MGGKYHIVETVSKFNRKFVETESKLIPLTHMYIDDRSLSWLKVCDVYSSPYELRKI